MTQLAASYPHLTRADRAVISRARRNWLRERIYVGPNGASQYRQFFKLARAGVLLDRGMGVDEDNHMRDARIYELSPLGWKISCAIAGEPLTKMPTSNSPAATPHTKARR
jgi:hypothetical protein